MNPQLLELMAGSSSNDASPFTPISNNFLLWLEGSNFNGTTWTATKGTTPTKYGTVTSATVNGYPSALFGSNGYFGLSSITLPSSLAVFAVCQEVSGAPLLVEQSENANSQNGFYFYTNAGYPYDIYRSSVGSRVTWNPTGNVDWFPAGQLAIGSTNWDGSTFTLSLNGSTVSSYNSDGSPSSYASNINTTNTLYIGCRAGANLFFNGGYLAELILSPALSAADLAIVNNYLKSKYGL